MDRNTFNVYACAIVTTLAEEDIDGAPESYLGLACNGDFMGASAVVHALVLAGILTNANNYVRITPTGRNLAAQINAATVKA